MNLVRILSLVRNLWLVVWGPAGTRSRSRRQPGLAVNIMLVGLAVGQAYDAYQVMLAVDGDDDNLVLPFFRIHD